MGKGFGIGLGVLVAGIIATYPIHHTCTRNSADFFCVNGKIKLKTPRKQKEHWYKLFNKGYDGFWVRQGTFFHYTLETYKKDCYTNREKKWGITVASHDYNFNTEAVDYWPPWLKEENRVSKWEAIAKRNHKQYLKHILAYEEKLKRQQSK